MSQHSAALHKTSNMKISPGGSLTASRNGGTPPSRRQFLEILAKSALLLPTLGCKRDSAATEPQAAHQVMKLLSESGIKFNISGNYSNAGKVVLVLSNDHFITTTDGDGMPVLALKKGMLESQRMLASLLPKILTTAPRSGVFMEGLDSKWLKSFEEYRALIRGCPIFRGNCLNAEAP